MSLSPDVASNLRLAGPGLPALAAAAREARRPRRAVSGVCLASLSGVLWFVGCGVFDLSACSWVATIPALYAIERAPSVRRAVFFAWWAGLVMNAGGFYWAVGLLERFAQVSRATAVLLFLLLCAYQASRLMLFGWIVRSIRRRRDVPLALLAPSAMVTVELCVPFIFPYYLGLTQAWQPHVIQIAELTGPLGVTALLLMVHGAAYDVLAGRGRRLKTAAASLLILVAVLGYGHLRIGQLGERRAHAPKIKVGIVQPNVASEQMGGGALFEAKQLAELQRQSAALESAGAELIVWPESSFPRRLPRRLGAGDPSPRPADVPRGFEAPLIMNALTYETAEQGGRTYNSALMLGRDGRVASVYDKNNLLAFGEYVPGLKTFPRLRRLVPPSVGDLTPGAGAVTFPFVTPDSREWRIGPMICLEDILPAFGRRLAALRPHLMVAVSNDSWFGDTGEPWQHLALSVYRSVESRTELVRAGQTGVSAYVDATGRVYAQTYSVDPVKEPRGPDRIIAEVALMEGGHTVYAAVGDLFGYLCAAVTAGLWLVSTRASRLKARARATE